MVTESAALQRERGVLARTAIPRRELGRFTKVERDPVEMVMRRDAGRVASLVPLRHARMAESQFAFFRGSAGLMAFDLAQQAQTDTQLAICGDAHINNFGLYASPERRLVFDLNDFDEAASGPWEWDVKRLLTSAILAAQELDLSQSQIEEVVLGGAKAYANGLSELLEKSNLERHYVSVDSSRLAEKVRADGIDELERATSKAVKRDADRTVAHLMTPDRMGYIRFKEEPPVLTHVQGTTEEDINKLLEQYRKTTVPDIGFLLTNYAQTDLALRVVGVGSVGTRCFLSALTGPDGSGLILQVKEAVESVVERYNVANMTTPRLAAQPQSQGERVVDYQRILQAVSDPFLGHVVWGDHHYYVRQYRDAKGSFDTRRMNVGGFNSYVRLCAWMLARAHSQSPMAYWVGAYIGGGTAFARAMLSWCQAYSEQVSEDYRKYLLAIEEGRVSVEMPEAVDL